MNLGDLIKKRKKEYDEIKKVFCPVLDCDIVFNAKGWHHLIYWQNRKRRVRKDLLRRLTLFPQAKKIISSNKCGIRAEYESKFTNIFLERGKITIMLQKKIDSSVIYYYSIWDD